jgi:ABC-type transporter Mla subunit MlaD
LQAIGDNPLPIVASAPSKIDQIFAGAPELLARANELAAELKDLFGDENRQRVSQILTDVEMLTGSLARGAPDVERAMTSLGQIADAASALGSLTDTIGGRTPQLMDQIDGAFLQIANAARSADNAIANVTPTLDALQLALNDVLPSLAQSLSSASGSVDQIPALTEELTKTSRSVRRAADSAREVLIESRGPLSGFMGDGLTELYRFITEARLLVSGLTRLSDRLEQNGPGFIFRGSNEGFEVK